jgi:hypothetical protein
MLYDDNQDDGDSRYSRYALAAIVLPWIVGATIIGIHYWL